jgi:hypothetical protein
MAQADTKYILVDWEERETFILNKDELESSLELVVKQNQTLDDVVHTDDLDLEVFKITKTQNPKRIVLQLNVTRTWKELT